jgi:hypothetical protein
MNHLPGLLAVAVGVSGIVAGQASDAPGALLVGIALIIAAVAFYAPTTRPVLAACVGVAGIAAGLADDAPGAVLLGMLIVAGALMFSVRGTRRRLAD